MKHKGLIVAESFYSMQGEGQTMGIPCVFLRLGGCNLLCEGKGWRCDTIEVWKKGIMTPYEEVLKQELVHKLATGAHLVITGGEPLMQQQAILEYLHVFYTMFEFIPTIEIETNGTIKPDIVLCKYVKYWNVSPKLSSSGETFIRRFKADVLNFFNLEIDNNVCFKFVISSKKDVDEMVNDFCEEISFRKVILMPAGSSQKELEITRQLTAESALEFNIRYCDRLHISIWNQKTGV